MKRTASIFCLSALSFLILFSVCRCSDLTDSGDTGRIRINYLLDDVEDAVRNYNPQNIIDLLHRDFFHNGRDRKEQAFIWEQRLLNYFSLRLEDRTFEIRNDYAVVYFDMILKGDGETVFSEEPSDEFGDLSYLLKDDGDWYLYGNQK